MANAAASATPEHLVVIIGAGPGGICASILLQDQGGIEDSSSSTRPADFGGQLARQPLPRSGGGRPGIHLPVHVRAQPEVAADVPAMGRQVWEYHRTVARQHGLYEHARWDTRVVKEEWDDAAGLWRAAHRRRVADHCAVRDFGDRRVSPPRTTRGIPGYLDFTGEVLRPNAWESRVRPARQARRGDRDRASWSRSPRQSRHCGRLARGLPAHSGLGAPETRRRNSRSGRTRHGRANRRQTARREWRTCSSRGALRVAYQTLRPLFRWPRRGSTGRSTSLPRRRARRATNGACCSCPDTGRSKRPTLSNSFLQTFNRDNVELIDADRADRFDGIITADGVHHRLDATSWPPVPPLLPTRRATSWAPSSGATIRPRRSTTRSDSRPHRSVAVKSRDCRTDGWWWARTRG